MIFHYLRLIGEAYNTRDWKWKMQWLIRHELGEATGRPHFHFVLKLPDDTAVSKNDIFRLNALWKRQVAGAAGKPDIRFYDPARSGVEYIMKADQGWFTSGANQYEMNKFYFSNCESLDLPLLIAPSALWELRKQKRSGVGMRDDSTGTARYLRSLRAVKLRPGTNGSTSHTYSPPESFRHPHSRI